MEIKKKIMNIPRFSIVIDDFLASDITSKELGLRKKPLQDAKRPRQHPETGGFHPTEGRRHLNAQPQLESRASVLHNLETRANV